MNQVEYDASGLALRAKGGGGRTFEIIDGVRRSKAAELAGKNSDARPEAKPAFESTRSSEAVTKPALQAAFSEMLGVVDQLAAIEAPKVIGRDRELAGDAGANIGHDQRQRRDPCPWGSRG